MKTAVISDTHNLLRQEAAEIIRDCGTVIHGGDICSPKILEEIRAVMKKGAPLFAVRGNCDSGLWAEEIPLKLEFELSGVRFFLVHNKKDIPEDLKADVVVFGHSHKYYEEIRDNRLWLNPGSCGRRRFNLPVTMAVMDINKGEYSVKRIELLKEFSTEKPDKNLLKNIEFIMKLMDKGYSIEAICKKTGLDSDFVEQTARIIVTHPGVDAEGIMNKTEVKEAMINSPKQIRCCFF